MRRTDSDEEREWVERRLTAILRNAKQDADLVAAFLEANGIKPLPESERQVDTPVPTGPVADMFLNIAAAMRLKWWERAGVTSGLQIELPSSTDALVAAGKCVTDPQKQPRNIPLEIFKASMTYLSDEAPLPVALPREIDVDAFLDRLADFLHANRDRLSNAEERNTNG